MEGAARLRDDSPRRFLDTVLAKLEKHHPTVYRRVDRSAFAPAAGPNDLLQGGVTPTVRQTAWRWPTASSPSRWATQAVVDPLCGQGANMAPYAAFVLGEEIVRQSVFDERFARRWISAAATACCAPCAGPTSSSPCLRRSRCR